MAIEELKKATTVDQAKTAVNSLTKRKDLMRELDTLETDEKNKLLQKVTGRLENLKIEVKRKIRRRKLNENDREVAALRYAEGELSKRSNSEKNSGSNGRNNSENSLQNNLEKPQTDNTPPQYTPITQPNTTNEIENHPSQDTPNIPTDIPGAKPTRKDYYSFKFIDNKTFSVDFKGVQGKDQNSLKLDGLTIESKGLSKEIKLGGDVYFTKMEYIDGQQHGEGYFSTIKVKNNHITNRKNYKHDIASTLEKGGGRLSTTLLKLTSSDGKERFIQMSNNKNDKGFFLLSTENGKQIITESY